MRHGSDNSTACTSHGTADTATGDGGPGGVELEDVA